VDRSLQELAGGRGLSFSNQRKFFSARIRQAPHDPESSDLIDGRLFRRNSMSQEFTMSVDSAPPRAAAPPVFAALLPIIAVVFIAFLVIGLALPVLPLHVHQGLGLGAFVVGLVAGTQFAASLLSRFWAGHYADSRGAKRATVTGLVVAAVAGCSIFCRSAFSASR
jgi:hypothetical protein